MSYIPHTWIDGEDITATKLNALEQGVAQGGSSGGGFVVIPFHYDSSTTSLVLEMTWQEIFDGMASGTVYVYKNLVGEYDGWSVAAPAFDQFIGIDHINEDYYGVGTYYKEFWTDSASGYPSCNIGD